MLKIPQKIDHALFLMLQLAEGFKDELKTARPVSLEGVARQGGISHGYLEEVAGLLRSAGLIAGRRGAGGGYVLAKTPGDITVADVITAMEGRTWTMECLSGSPNETRVSANDAIWRKIQGQVMTTLYGMTIAELAAENTTAITQPSLRPGSAGNAIPSGSPRSPGSSPGSIATTTMKDAAKEKEKIFVTDIDPARAAYDERADSRSKYVAPKGLTRETVLEISRQKSEPKWMLEKRLKAFDLFRRTPFPSWGPPLVGLDLDQITYFVRPDADESKTWEEVPAEIRATFEKLGIPEAERNALSGVGAQYDSDVVYHNLKKEWADLGVVFENMDVAVRKHSDLVKKYFMTDCIPIHDHKFIMLHAAVWSGGTFIYVPPGVNVRVPLQAYFRMNQESGGQFEHTLIIVDKGASVDYIEGCSAPRFAASALHAGCVELHVKEGATIRYSSIENWSKNTYNLNTKRAVVDRGGKVEWLNGNMGSGTTMLYPCSVLRGEGARSESIGVAFAGPGQNQDTGSKVIHAAPRTTSVIRAKSISKGGGIASYRGLVRVTKAAKDSVSSVNCDALVLDADSVSNTYPTMRIDTDAVEMSHEATVGRIGEEEIFYLMSRGLTEQQAAKMIVSGFIEPVVKRLPMEYAIELNKLIELEMTGGIG